MNKILLSISLLLLAHTSFAGHHQAGEKIVKTADGYHFSDEGVNYEIFPGDTSLVDIVVNYAKAHNDRDLEAINDANTEDFKAYLSNGIIIEGRAAHAEFLKELFATSNQKWEYQWGTANNVVVADGSIEQWVNVGYKTSYIIDGKEVSHQEVQNIYIKNGKVGRIFVHSRLSVPQK